MNAFRDRLLGFLHADAGATDWTRDARVETVADEIDGRHWRVSTRPDDGDDFVLRFRDELTAVGGEVLDGRGDAAAGLEACLREVASSRAMRVAVDADPLWGVGLPSWSEIECSPDWIVERVDGSTTAQVLAACDIGLTIADWAIAETGTICQLQRSFRPRALSLLPGCHLAILPVDRLLAGLEDFFEVLDANSAAGFPDGDAYCTWITGPSRTADIEKVLTVGVHGPCRQIVLVVDEPREYRSSAANSSRAQIEERDE